MTKFLQKGDYYLSLMKVAHFSFVRVEITCVVHEKHFLLYSTSYKLGKKRFKVIFVTWKGNREELKGRSSLELIV